MITPVIPQTQQSKSLRYVHFLWDEQKKEKNYKNQYPQNGTNYLCIANSPDERCAYLIFPT